MRSTPFVTTAALLLGFATVALAQHRDGDRNHRDDYRYRDGYDDRYRDDFQSERVAAIAHEIERTAAAMHGHYERNNRRPDRSEAQVAAALHELHERADRFHREVESNHRDSRHSTPAYSGLLRAFDEVAYSLEHIRPRPYVDRGMDRIWSLTSELERYYGRRGRSGRGYDGAHRNYGSRGRYPNDDGRH